jgi:toxoflavin synthase
MTTDYDSIAEEYKRAKLQPWRQHIESFTLMGLIGGLAGKAVVDLACGEGFYTRLLRQHGAAKVLGVDLSERMVGLAQAQEANNPLGIEYVVGDGRNLALGAEYDLAVAAYLLNYARNRDELDAMCRGIAHCLKPGGRFVAVNTNPAIDLRSTPSYRKYGFEAHIGGELREGAPITWTFFLPGDSLSVENYYLDVAAHEAAFRSAGFREVRWHRPELSLQGELAHEEGYWARFMDNPPVIFIECLI